MKQILLFFLRAFPKQGNAPNDNYLDWPADPEEYKIYLTDVIQLKDTKGNVTGELVAGKGLVWFKYRNGKKWTLQE